MKTSPARIYVCSAQRDAINLLVWRVIVSSVEYLHMALKAM